MVLSDWDFNTSHVNVNPNNLLDNVPSVLYFNTSHVNVNRGWAVRNYLHPTFQYISC